MRSSHLHRAFAVMLATGAVAGAQQPATTVQLPTFSQFTVRTTVSIPDGGSALLGGLDRGFESTTSRGIGPLGSRGSSSGRAASGVSALATIVDHAELDRAILAAAASRRTSVATVGKAREIEAAVPTNRLTVPQLGVVRDPAALPGSVAAIRQAQAAEDLQRSAMVDNYWKQASEAEAAGKPAVAKVYYQWIARHGSGNLSQQAAARLAALGTPRPENSAR